MKLSLAGWSLQRLFRAPVHPLRLVDFPAFVRNRFGLEAIELNSPFFPSRESRFLRQLVAAADKAQMRMLNIAVDEVGDLSADNDLDRNRAVQNYARWVPVAAELGCTAIRANTGGMGIIDVNRALICCIDSFRRLADMGVKHGVSILIENHGGLSAEPGNIIAIVDEVRLTHGNTVIGTMPDYGNFPDTVDRLASLAKLLPFAKAVHAKVYDIDEQLNHPRFDLQRCITLTRECGYDGYIGIEYHGSADPIEGVMRAIAKLGPMTQEC
jgi:sugar phosphate isomerase/epimerase